MVPYASSHHDRLLRVIIVVVEEVDWIVSRRVLEAFKTSTVDEFVVFPKTRRIHLPLTSSHIVVRARIAMYHQQQNKIDIDEFLDSALIQRPPNQ